MLSAPILCCAELDKGDMREPSVECVPSSAKFPIVKRCTGTDKCSLDSMGIPLLWAAWLVIYGAGQQN